MTQITGGVVRYMRRVNTGNYEHKEAAAEFTFGVSEGVDHGAVLEQAQGLALVTVDQLLTGKAVAAQGNLQGHAAIPQTSLAAIPVTTTDPAPAATATKKGPGRPPKTPAAPDTTPIPETVKAEDDPLGLTTVTTDPIPPETAKIPDPPADEDLFGSAEAEVTDKALMEAITKRNGEIKAPPAIRILIGKYVEHPGQAKDIPQAKRGAFLTELAVLKA